MQPFLTMIGLKPKPLDDGPRYATMNDRCMASAIDMLLLFLLLSSATAYVSDVVYAAFDTLPPHQMPAIGSFQQLGEMLWQTRTPWLISNGMAILLMGIVYVACQIAYATTPGKWLLGLKIVHASTLEPIRSWRYGLRFLAYIPSAAPLMLGVFAGLFSKRNRTLHDVIAGTVVINTRPKGWYWQKVKVGYRWLKSTLTGSRPVEQTVSEPTAEQRHEDRSKPIE